MKQSIHCLFFISFLFAASAVAQVSYRVEYMGIDDPVALKTVKSIAHLNTLKKTPPGSIHALRYRAESDIPEILKVLHANGYYEATVQIQVEDGESKAHVVVKVNQGPLYHIGSCTFSVPDLRSEDLGLKEGDPASSFAILQVELKALQKLSQEGYPLACISDRSITVDGDTKLVSVHFSIDTGPLTQFGPVSFKGNRSVKERFLEERLGWQEGSTYNGLLLEETQKNLLDTGLFSSVLITHDEEGIEEQRLPLQVEVSETKHKSIYGGVSYQTYYGLGVTAGWENRNVGGMGRTFSIQGDLTKRSHSGNALYSIPHFLRVDQDCVWQARAMHLNILPYNERSYHLTSRLERKFHKNMRAAFGIAGERLFVNSSVQDGEYWILESPIFLGINFANSLLDPTEGVNFEYTATPSLIFSPERRFFLFQEFGLSYYIPLDTARIFTIAQKLSGGFILSGGEGSVPVPKRFFGGSEEDLRGYAYYSVSPLTGDNRPIGGRSAIYYTLETRLRATKKLGIVPFFDLGNVSWDRFLSWHGKWYKSAGIGVRYFSFVGPFRLDIGFPLNPRKGLDKKYRILVSVGQSF